MILAYFLRILAYYVFFKRILLNLPIMWENVDLLYYINCISFPQSKKHLEGRWML